MTADTIKTTNPTSDGDNNKLVDPLTVFSNALQAIEDNKPDLLTEILDQDNIIGGTLNKETLGSLLLRACELGTLEMSIPITLMNRGANVNRTNNDQSSSCLMIAAKQNNPRLVEFLIQLGAKVNATDKYGWTPLFYASYFGNVDCAKVLLEHGAHLTLVDCDKMSCLIWASGRGHLDVVRLLLEQGALINALDGYNNSALVWASRKGETQVVKLLIENGAAIDKQGMYGWTPLLVAVIGNHKETVSLLLSYGANYNLSDGKRMTPLLVACKDGYTDIALCLIEAGANVNDHDKNGNTPLIYATMLKDFTLVKALVESGAYIELLGQDERNAVHWSIIRNDIDSCRLFLENNIDMNFTNSCGETYLMIAARYCHQDIIKLFLDFSPPSQNGMNNQAVNGRGNKINNHNNGRQLMSNGKRKPSRSIDVESQNKRLIEALLSKQSNKCDPIQALWQKYHEEAQWHPIE